MKNILIGITGSIAAYKTVFLVRELRKKNYNCKVLISSGGLRFVTPEIFAGFDCEVYTDKSINITSPDEAMLHINLAKWADLIMIVPASANSIARIAAGLANDIISEIILVAGEKPRYIAPAMNYQMWKNSITQRNIQTLIEHGFKICSPDKGIQACGDIGEGRMQEPEKLLSIIENTFMEEPPLLKNKKVLITLGGTIEAIDPVRFISNHSSGKMGVALINALLNSGASVTALYGNINVELPSHDNLKTMKTLSAEEMLLQTMKEASNQDIFIGCAAVCDYRVANIASEKIKKTADSINLELIKNPDILVECKKRFPNLFYVGFAAETESVIDNAIEKLKRKSLDMIIANAVDNGKVFDQSSSEATIITKTLETKHFKEQSKNELAKEIILQISQNLIYEKV